MQPFQLRQLTSRLNQGDVIAYPTETVWGLGCLPNNLQALTHLAQIKQRSLSKGFILVSPNIELCLPFIDKAYHQLAQKKIRLNPHQATTWVAPKSALVSPLLSGHFSTIAIRISPHPFINNICQLTQLPLVSTSVNISKKPSLNSSLLITKQFQTLIFKVVKGYLNGSGKSSHIYDLISDERLR